MPGTDHALHCPHCGKPMLKWQVPLASTWSHDFFFVCFNDECPYFVEGWRWMWAQQATYASYRCRWDPDQGKFLPLPVWSVEALKESILNT